MLSNIFPWLEFFVPGVRLLGDHQDQKRVVTPCQAIERGATRVIVGREIRDAENRVAMADQIVRDIARFAKRGTQERPFTVGD